MTSLNISLPKAMRRYIESRVKKGTYSTPSEYIRALVREDEGRKARGRIEALIREGLDTPASEMTAADWADLQRRVWQRHAGRARK